jgi:hypothetical protein
MLFMRECLHLLRMPVGLLPVLLQVSAMHGGSGVVLSLLRGQLRHLQGRLYLFCLHRWVLPQRGGLRQLLPPAALLLVLLKWDYLHCLPR